MQSQTLSAGISQKIDVFQAGLVLWQFITTTLKRPVLDLSFMRGGWQMTHHLSNSNKKTKSTIASKAHAKKTQTAKSRTRPKKGSPQSSKKQSSRLKERSEKDD
jgi:hypothetical protein